MLFGKSITIFILKIKAWAGHFACNPFNKSMTYYLYLFVER